MKRLALLALLMLTVGARYCRSRSLNWPPRRTPSCVRARVQCQCCRRDREGRIYTETELTVLEVWKGPIAKDVPLRVVQGGGTLRIRRSRVSGQAHYGIGEETLCFLIQNDRKEWVTLGAVQGKFTIRRDPSSGLAQAYGFNRILTLKAMKQMTKTTAR